MYARLLRFSLGPGKREVAQRVADDMPAKIAAMPGCLSVTVFADDDGECGIFVIWEQKENAEAAAPLIRPQVDERIQGHTTAEPIPLLCEVLGHLERGQASASTRP